MAGLFIEAEEFEDERFLEHILRAGNELALFREPLHARLVTTEGEAFVEAGGFLAFEFGQRPAFVGGLDLVETAFARIFDGEEQDVMGPTEGEGLGGLPRWLLGNCQFVRRLLKNLNTIFPGEEEAPHVGQIDRGKAVAEFLRQPELDEAADLGDERGETVRLRRCRRG
jgi:hypothetical protein